jgi:hypothetical protein
MYNIPFMEKSAGANEESTGSLRNGAEDSKNAPTDFLTPRK